jgi:cytoskeleton protein RodZ
MAVTVMPTVGVYLRELRTRRGVSLDEIARTTRVAPRYLTALENDTFSELPAPVFIRGFIRAYCQALGESPQEALSHYDGPGGRPTPAAARAAAPPRAAGAEPRSRGSLLVSFVLLVILGMALFTVALVLRPGDRTERQPVAALPDVRPAQPPLATPAETPPPAVAPSTSSLPPEPSSASAPQPATPRPSAVSVPPAQSPAGSRSPSPATSAATATTQPEASAATPRIPAPGDGASAVSPVEAAIGSVSSPYRLVARTSEATWIRVRTDDGRSSEETVPAGEIREWVSNRPFVLTVGNAAGVSLELNGRPLPPLGARGVVVPRLVLPPEPR